jgi:hypothetical protein
LLEIRPQFLRIVYNFYFSFMHSILCNQYRGYESLKFFYTKVISVMAMGGSFLYIFFSVGYRVEFSYKNVYDINIMIGSIIV